MNKIKQDSFVLFYFNSTKKWLAKISKEKELHTHIGVIRHSDAIGKEYGSKLVTNKDKYVYLLEPTIHDFIMKIQHGTQIVYPNGHVYTFDVDSGFMKIAQKNIEKANLIKYVTMKKLDLKVAKRMPVSNADLVLIDLGDPWTVVPQARKMLKGSGGLFAICPTMNQLEKLTSSLIQNEFTDIECTEHILRTIEAREGKTRHSFQGIGHTTYLAYARKVFFEREKLRRTISKNDKSKTK